jgi:inositol-phosphate phosphatase / L-galactose 1-phosphate phosphatase / histidinol-phosphatase
MTFDNRELALAQHLADEAGKILRRHWRTGLNVEQKADASPVTLADRECEEHLRTLIEKAFPDHGIIGEEHGNLRSDALSQWVIDPIDGTRSFIAGYPIFATLIALTKDGVPVVGIIDQPITRERWTGVKGDSATCNGEPVTASRTQSLTQAVIATTSTYYFTQEEAALFATFKHQCAQTVLGGDAYAYAMLASGQLDIVIDAGMKPYDFCALVPVIEGAGGIITDWNGAALTPASAGRVIACANEKLHEQALKLIQSATI